MISKDKVISFYQNNESSVSASFFAGGFGFDIFTLGRIDDSSNIIFQSLYLLICLIFLFFKIVHQENPFHLTGRFEKVWRHRTLIFHFCLGALLSAYALFYFKSSSLSTSFIFMIIIFTLLILNELEFFQNLGLEFKIVLISLCAFSFFCCLVPLIYGKLNFWTTFSALLLTFALFFMLYHLAKKYNENSKRIILLPTTITLIFLFLLYILKIIPPIPLSVKEISIYHDIKKLNNSYEVSYKKPLWYQFWRKSNDDFEFLPGDNLVIFTRVFSPGNFADNISIQMHFKMKNGDWLQGDNVPLKITGGRDDGFRGFIIKKNYSPGTWRAMVKTADNREIGRLTFKVKEESNKERQLAKALK